MDPQRIHVQQGSFERQVMLPLLLVLPALFIIYGDKEAGFIPELLGQSYSSVG